MAKLTKTDLATQKNTRFADNTAGEITAARLRNHLTDIEDSMANISAIGDGQHVMGSAVDGVLQPSSISEDDTEIAIEKPAVFVPRVGIGSSELRVLGELVYFATGVTSRTFTPAGAPFDSNGTGNLMYVKLDAVEQLPASANQTIRDETLALSAGQSMSFVQPGGAGTNHISRQFVIDLTQAGSVRLEIFAGTDATGRRLVDQVFTGLTVGENTLQFESYPYINPAITYFIRYTAVTPITIRGTTIATVFVPYSVTSGWPYSEVRVLTDEDGAYVADLLEALTGNDRLDYNALRNLPASGAAALTSTNISVDAAVTSGVWNPPSFNGTHLILDSGEVTGGVSSINAPSGTVFGNDTFFAISNLDTGSRDFTLDATVLPFSGLASGRTFSLPGRTTTFFYSDVGSPAPIANFSTGAAGSAQAIVVARDTPTLSVLGEIASASRNSNSGFWLVADDQIAANESGIDSSIQVRALTPNLLDADGGVLSQTAVAKSGVRLQAGSQVRVFSATDLRVVSTPERRRNAERYPDLPVSAQIHITTQVQYNIYRNRTMVLTGSFVGQTVEFRLFSLQNAADAAFINRNDVFCFRNDSQGTFEIRTFQVGTTFSSNNNTDINLAPGQLLCITPAPSGAVFTVLEFGQATTLAETESPIILNEWYKDEINAIASDNPLRMHNRSVVADGIVRNHIKTSSFASNPVSLRFQQRNIQDDIAWVQWWSTFQAIQPLGTSVQEIEANLPSRISAIETTINNGYDFEFNDPGVFLGITSISHISGNTYRVNLGAALPDYIAVNDTLTISGVALAAFNADWAVDLIAGDRLAFDITRTPNNGATDDQGVGGLVSRTIYADAVLVSHLLRQVNFDLYTNSARTIPLSAIPADWFDIETQPVPANNVLSIGYNTDIETTGAFAAFQDDAGDFFLAKGGPRGTITFFDNRTVYNNGFITKNRLPVTAENIVIDTSGVARFILPEFPDELAVSEIRRYRIFTDQSVVSTNDVEVFVGEDGNELTFDEGISSITILPSNYIDLELYNDGVRNGVRLASPIQRTRIAAPTLSATPLSTAQIDPLPISVVNVITAQDEDPNEDFIDVDTTNRRLILRADADYNFEASVTVQYGGTEPTSAFLFGTLSLVPITNRSASDTVQTSFRDVVSLEMERGGLTGAAAPKPQHTLRTRFDWQGQANDTVRFRLSLDQVPAGFSAADFEVLDFTWTATVQLGLN